MPTPAQSFQGLLVWQKAHAFVLAIYKTTETFPKHELFGLTSQLRRAAVSIPANIAEGFRRRTHADKARFYNISQGSIEECRYYLILVRDLHYAKTTLLEDQLDEVARLLYRYIANLGKTTPLSASPSS